MARLLTILFIFASSVFVQAEEIYSWRDEKGKLHFGDKPPEHLESSQIDTRKISPTNSSDRVEISKQQPKTRANQTKTTNKDQKEKDEQQKLISYCQGAQEEYNKLTTYEITHVSDDWGKNVNTHSRASKVLYDESGKSLTSREQVRIAEELRKNANFQGCNIKQNPGLRLDRRQKEDD